MGTREQVFISHTTLQFEVSSAGLFQESLHPQPPWASSRHQPARGSPDLSATDPRQIWQFLDNDGAIVERGLEALRDGIGHQHGHQHRQCVNDLARYLKGQQCCGEGVGHRPREGSSTCRDTAKVGGGSQARGQACPEDKVGTVKPWLGSAVHKEHTSQPLEGSSPAKRKGCRADRGWEGKQRESRLGGW